jgi:hypothetical protein
MKIAYTSMWQNFNPKNNWFNEMFEEYYGQDDIEFSLNNSNADIVLSSVFGNPKFSAASKQIFYTGETRKDGYSENQILLGFDETNIDKKIFRLPHWYLYINWWGDKFNLLSGAAYDLDVDKLSKPLTEQEVSQIMSREKFCSIVSSNNIANRFDTTLALAQIDKVDAFGSQFGNRFEQDKLDLISNYKFNICFENTLDPGYVTEKLLEAKIAGCIPIYWGDKKSEVDFNKKCFINYADFESVNDLATYINKLYSSKDAMEEIIAEPLFNSPPSLAELYEFFDKVGLKEND